MIPETVGRASFKVIFKAAPDDDDFSKLEPVARVIVVAKDPTPGAKPLQ